MNKTKRLSISLSFPYDIITGGDCYEAVVVGFNKMSAEGKTEFLAQEELRRAIKAYVQSAINQGIPLPKFIEVR